MDVFLLLLVLISGCGGAKRWLVVGGLADGPQGQLPIKQVEVLEVNDETRFYAEQEWCTTNLTDISLELDGATINHLPIYGYIDANMDVTTGFSIGETGPLWDQVLVCGGADLDAQLQSGCRWWKPIDDTWVDDGPTLRIPRFHAAAITNIRNGYLWMLGGRAGSTILSDTEILWFPHKQTGALVGSDHDSSSGWQWVNQQSADQSKWTQIPADQRSMPMALTGHCAVTINIGTDLFALVIGGATPQTETDGTVQKKIEQIVSKEVHLYDFQLNKWYSTLYESKAAYRNAPDYKPLSTMVTARMNPGCIAFQEGTQTKVMVTGGISRNAEGQSIVLDSTESFDVTSGTWRLEAPLPNKITGAKMAIIGNQPSIIGRFGFENTNKILRYSLKQVWETMPIDLMTGRSDFQLMELPTSTVIQPKSGGVSSGPEKTFTLPKLLKGVEFTTGKKIHPWIRLNLGAEYFIHKVVFESAGVATCTECVDPAGLVQLSEVRVGNSAVPNAVKEDVLFTHNTACTQQPDGVNDKEAVCNLRGRHVTLQLLDASADFVLGIKSLRVYVTTPSCLPDPVPPPPPAGSGSGSGSGSL